MQYVLNSDERSQAFWQFLFFFLVTMILIIGAIYFNFYQVPEKEKNFYKGQVFEQREEDNKQQDFLHHMNQARLLLDSVEKSGTDFGEVEQQLNKELNALSNIRSNDSIYMKLNDALTASYRELKLIKKERIELVRKAGDTDKLNAELVSVKEERDRCQGLLKAQDNSGIEDFR